MAFASLRMQVVKMSDQIDDMSALALRDVSYMVQLHTRRRDTVVGAQTFASVPPCLIQFYYDNYWNMCARTDSKPLRI